MWWYLDSTKNLNLDQVKNLIQNVEHLSKNISLVCKILENEPLHPTPSPPPINIYVCNPLKHTHINCARFTVKITLTRAIFCRKHQDTQTPI